MADKPKNMGPFGDDDEVQKLVKYGIEHDRQRLMAAGMLHKPSKEPQGKKKD